MPFQWCWFWVLWIASLLLVLWCPYTYRTCTCHLSNDIADPDQRWSVVVYVISVCQNVPFLAKSFTIFRFLCRHPVWSLIFEKRPLWTTYMDSAIPFSEVWKYRLLISSNSKTKSLKCRRMAIADRHWKLVQDMSPSLSAENVAPRVRWFLVAMSSVNQWRTWKDKRHVDKLQGCSTKKPSMNGDTPPYLDRRPKTSGGKERKEMGNQNLYKKALHS